MWQWLNNWRRAISKPKLAVDVEEQILPPPTTLLHSARRETVAQSLPYKLAVDPLETSLFYRSLDGKIVSRSLASGAIEWQSQESGYPLRVTDQILWALQDNAIAAYSITDGQLLMRSHPLWLPGKVIYSLCDLSQQTLWVYLRHHYPWMGGTPAPSHEDLAAYQIHLMTGEVTPIYQFKYAVTSEYSNTDKIVCSYHPNFSAVNEQAYRSISPQQLLNLNFVGSMMKSAQLLTASVILHDYRFVANDDTGYERERIVLSVFSHQPPYEKQWEAILEDYQWFPPPLPHC
jgi:hypothetical protein